MIEEYAVKLADLVLTKGLAFKKGQCLQVVTAPESYEYARVFAEKAYERGAKFVYIDVSDRRIDAKRSLVQDVAGLEYIPSFLRSLPQEMVDEDWARVRLDSGEARIDDYDSDESRLAIMSKARSEANKAYSYKSMRHDIAWNVAVCPGPRWAAQVLGEGSTEEDLAMVLSRIMGFDGDYLAYWDDLDRRNKKRCAILDSLDIKTLHYKSKETDFYVSYNPNRTFQGGSRTISDGRVYFPNLPTEEIFTCPDMDTAEGYIRTTRPVDVLGTRCEGITFHFEKGSVVSFTADSGAEAIESLLDTDEGSRRLGETAFVDQSSPICRSGLVFGSILVDENASCHIAIGASYPDVVKGGAEADEQGLKALGLNSSLVHVDFMVGSDDMTITAESYDGRRTVIMENGRFTF